MPSIAIVTDSDASLPPEIAARFGIRQVPITVHFGNEIYQTGVDIDDARLFARIDREGRLPTTAAPSPGMFATAFGEAFDAGADMVLCLTVSSEVSATYNAALTAADLFPARPGQLAETNGSAVMVIDTRTLSLAQGYMVVAAAEAAARGRPLSDCISAALDVRDRAYLFAALSTLRYVAMSGRVGAVAAGMGDLLAVKPIVTIRAGKLDMLERVRTQSRAWRRTIELTVESLQGRPAEHVAMLHVNAAADAVRFEAQFRAALTAAKIPHPAEFMCAELTPGLSVHAGAGLVGVAVVAAG
jgi:DegV family protein with EDD domain